MTSPPQIDQATDREREGKEGREKRIENKNQVDSSDSRDALTVPRSQLSILFISVNIITARRRLFTNQIAWKRWYLLRTPGDGSRGGMHLTLCMVAYGIYNG